ncbi:hypothetical protein Tco_0864268 [Tanacetum coccineum]
MEDEFYHLTMKRNDLKTYVRRFQELATLCPTMVPDSEKMIEVFIGELPRSENPTLVKPTFQIDLMPIKLSSFDVVIGMDIFGYPRYHAGSSLDEKKSSTFPSTVKY